MGASETSGYLRSATPCNCKVAYCCRILVFAGFARTEELFGIVLICATQLQTATYGGYRSLSSARVLSYAPPVCPAPTPSVLRAPSTNLRDHAILLSMILANEQCVCIVQIRKLTAAVVYDIYRAQLHGAFQHLALRRGATAPKRESESKRAGYLHPLRTLYT